MKPDLKSETTGIPVSSIDLQECLNDPMGQLTKRVADQDHQVDVKADKQVGQEVG